MQLINNFFINFKKTWRQNIIYIGFVVVFLFREQLEIMRGCSYYANKTLLA